ncbi:3-oxoacyl-[acyl-carrier-protein] reductase FabG [Frankliniella fusca]|uniref:3-oxoacyl-[acyl-carrier-protein] reductase FabG n=1 Tax=Frankliniella fusca TaxID=407009 RepID=A0AAE1GTH4_9NEOP|nr:3-oxoacyl-[acyl-carrier-protein] reductase FabG [Frankliniella fusca]
MSGLKDKVVLITGASSGIGAGTAIYFAKLGSCLALNGRNEDNLKAVVKQCVDAGLSSEKIFTVLGPVEDELSCKKIIEETVKYFGRLDCLINNAGILITGSFEAMSVEDFDKQMNVNVRSVFLFTKLATPHLKKTKGTIVNVSSVAGLRSFPNIAAYCTSKAAVDQMTRCTALDLAPYGIRVNAVNPGVIVTDIHKRAGMSEKDYAEFIEHSKSTHALGRAGTVDEVAKCIAFLASEDSSFTTGETVTVDGGRHAMCAR